MKKVAALFLTILILMFSALPMSASAVVAVVDNGLSFEPGNTRWLNPKYNYAWLDQLFVRAGSESVMLTELVPKPDDYPYSLTYEGFVEECDRYIDLYGIDEKTVGNVYNLLIEALYYGVVAMGMTEDVGAMSTYLANYGIDIPEELTTEDKMKIAVIYSAIEYNSIYILCEKKIDIPKGISLDAATVEILAAVTGTRIPAGVDSISGLGVYAVKEYVEETEELNVPLSKNPTAEELFYWLKVVIANGNDYEIPMDKYSKVTNVDKEYVNYVYFASILEMGYDVRINPEALLYANESSDSKAVHKLLLRTMLDEKGVEYSGDYSAEKLFGLACKNGYFPLENEFFSDVLKYELQVAPSCEKLWFTPITLGDQLNGGNKSALYLSLHGKTISPGATEAVTLTPSKSTETVYLEIIYNDGSRKDTAIYEFKVIKNPELEKKNSSSSTGTTDLVGQVQDYVNSVIPDNDTASQYVANIFGTTDSLVGEQVNDILSTYGAEAPEDSSETDRFDFDYLGELINDLYETDADGNIITTKTYTVTQSEENAEEETIIRKVTQTVAENPEIVAAPTSLIALGGLVGFLMNKKHKDSVIFTEEEEEEETEE